MIEDNNKTSLYSLDIIDFISLILRDINKILIITLLSISSWYIYYISHTPRYDTSIIIDSVPAVKLNYTNITVSNYLSATSLGGIKDQFLNNIEDYNYFKEFYMNQEVEIFDNIDDFYKTISIITDSNLGDRVNFTHEGNIDQKDFNNYLLGYIDYVHTITHQNILDILYMDLKGIETEINDMDYKANVVNELLLFNLKHTLSKNLLRDSYNIQQSIKLLEENILIANKLGYSEPIEALENYLLIEEAPISQENNNIYVETTNMVQSLSSNKTLFFLGTSVLEIYLNILNEYNKMDIDAKRNFYPELIAAIEIKSIPFDEQYIEDISNYKVALKQTNRMIENFENMKSEPNLVRYDKNKINTINQEVNYVMSFIVSCIIGLLVGIIYVLLFDVYRRKNHIS